jgi:hypothetical protein
MLFRETVAVYFENHTEHTNTLCVQNFRVFVCSVRTSQETHYVSGTKCNRLTLFRETVAVYCETHTERTNAPSTACYRKNITFFFLYFDEFLISKHSG